MMFSGFKCIKGVHRWMFTVLFNFISRISEFTYWWPDNSHPVFLDESNGFCNGMEIIQTCQWSDAVFCTGSDSEWVSRHYWCKVWILFWISLCWWERDFIETKVSFIICSVSKLKAKCTDDIKFINIGKDCVGIPNILLMWPNKISSNIILII